MEPAQIKRIVEAALLAASHPLTLPQLSALFDEFAMPPPETLVKAIESLQEDCADRGVELVEVASGFRYQVRQDVQAHIGRLWAEKPSRYSRALLETLALIAYRQPITRAEIESIVEPFDLLEPGLTYTPLWRPDPGGEDVRHPERTFTLAGVGRRT